MRSIVMITLSVLSLVACTKKETEFYLISGEILSSIDSTAHGNTAIRIVAQKRKEPLSQDYEYYYYSVTTAANGKFSVSLPVGESLGLSLEWANGKNIASSRSNYIISNVDFGIVYTTP